MGADGTSIVTQLYGPYGAVRYSSGSLPGTRAYTGQRADAATGLDYYGARYYDPEAGQFASADTADAGGLNRYGYVAGNPETRTDPSGHMYAPPPNGPDPRLDPNPKRPNYRRDYVRDYWTDVTAGTGRYLNIGRLLKQEADKDPDGDVLAAYFGLTVHGIDPRQGPTGTLPTGDYEVLLQQGVTVSGEGLLEVGDATPPKYFTAIDLYTPKAGTDWFAVTKDGNPKGVLAKIYSKSKQASIVVVDTSKWDPNGKRTTAELDALSTQAIWWSPVGNAKDPSQVVRVMWIRNGQVVADFDPFNFGPPGPSDRPAHIILN